MNYNQALNYIHSTSNFFCKPGLERIRKLCSLMGNPQDKLKFIHVAGTNGKGSFCAMLSSILSSAGYKTGLYTSPYILKFNERIAVDGEMISDDDLANLTNYIKQFADTLDDKPTEFEIITAIAFEYFQRCGCEYVVLECGLGGRFDATNVVTTSVLSVITGISIDHTDFLGDTTEKIAYEKAGIIKKGVPCLWCGNDESAYTVIKSTASKLSSELYLVEKNGLIINSFSYNGTEFNYKNYKNLFIKLLGVYQPSNAANVITATEILRKNGLLISYSNIKDGLKNTVWHGRFELLRKKPVFIYDGGHNVDGVNAAVESIKTYFGKQKVCVVTGVMKDKDYLYIANKISSVANKVFCVTPNNPRALSADEYTKIFIANGVESESYENLPFAVTQALLYSKKNFCPIIALGSLYMYGDILKGLNESL